MYLRADHGECRPVMAIWGSTLTRIAVRTTQNRYTTGAEFVIDGGWLLESGKQL